MGCGKIKNCLRIQTIWFFVEMGLLLIQRTQIGGQMRIKALRKVQIPRVLAKKVILIFQQKIIFEKMCRKISQCLLGTSEHVHWVLLVGTTYG